MGVDRGTVVLVVHWALCIFPSSLFLLCRFAVRFSSPDIFNCASDAFILLAYFFQLLNSIFMTVSYSFGNFSVAKSISHVDLGSTALSLKVAWVSVNMFWTALFAIKAAILAMYSPLIPRESRLHRMVFNALCGVVATSFVVVSLLNNVICMPISRIWSLGDLMSNGDHCFPASLPWVLTTSSVLHISTDVALFLMPFPLLVSLWKGGGVSRRSMLGLLGVFSAGFICVAATILRIIFATQPTDGVAKVSAWSAVELMTGIFVACFPAFRILSKKGTAKDIWKRTITSSGSNSGGDLEKQTRKSSSQGSTPSSTYSKKSGDEMSRIATATTSATLSPGIEKYDNKNSYNNSGEPNYSKNGVSDGARGSEGVSFEIASQTKRGTLKSGMVVWEGEEHGDAMWDEISMEDIEIDMDELGPPREIALA